MQLLLHLYLYVPLVALVFELNFTTAVRVRVLGVRVLRAIGACVCYRCVLRVLRVLRAAPKK